MNLTAILLSFSTLFTPARVKHDASVLLQGAFLSCPDNEDGSFGERVYQHVVHGKMIFTLHLGPADEFALFAGSDTDEHPDHNTKANLLFPAYHLGSLNTLRGDRNWSVGGNLNLSLSVVRAGGSDPECENFYVLLQQHAVTWAAR